MRLSYTKILLIQHSKLINWHAILVYYFLYLFVYQKLMIHTNTLSVDVTGITLHKSYQQKYKSDQITVHSSWTKNFYFFNFVTILLHCLCCPTCISLTRVSRKMFFAHSLKIISVKTRNKSKTYSQLRQKLLSTTIN